MNNIIKSNFTKECLSDNTVRCGPIFESQPLILFYSMFGNCINCVHVGFNLYVPLIFYKLISGVNLCVLQYFHIDYKTCAKARVNFKYTYFRHIYYTCLDSCSSSYRLALNLHYVLYQILNTSTIFSIIRLTADFKISLLENYFKKHKSNFIN